MPELTVKVLSGLQKEEVKTLDSLVQRSQTRQIDTTRGDPNIEIISDVLEAAILAVDPKDKSYTQFQAIRKAIREKIVEVFMNVNAPQIGDHVRFFTALNRILACRCESIWIFTPNYDLLLELGASLAKVPLYDGFWGASLRFFNIGTLTHEVGTIDGRCFQPYLQPTIRLVKLHGSLDWWKQNDAVYSSQKPEHIPGTVERVLVLPRRMKMSETLESPFEELFRIASKVLGSRCKYLVSCGYGFGDQHINETLLLPKLQQGKLHMTAFVKEDTPVLEPFKALPSFACGTETGRKKKNGPFEGVGTDLWQFEKLVDLICQSAGV
jgi:hypothetical protein